MDKVQKVIDNFSDLDIIDIHFVTLNKKKQQVKWSLELVHFDRIISMLAHTYKEKESSLN